MKFPTPSPAITPTSSTATVPPVARFLNSPFFSCVIANALSIGGAQVFRLGANLILTRLLFPEAFGLMALVNVFIIGLAMLSDFGIGIAIVQRKAEPDDHFINTGWTIQVLRGFGIWAAASLISAPVSNFYGEPALAILLPLIGFTEAIAGFKSPATHLYARQLRHFPLTVLDLVTGLFGLVVSVILAFHYPGVWALVAGSLSATLANVLGSYLLPGSTMPRFALSREHAREFFRFGKWVTLGTAFTFLSTQGDRLLLGRFLSPYDLGIYTVAFFFAQSATSFISGVANRVLVPVLAKQQSNTQSERRAANLRYRYLFLGGSLVPISGFLLGGPALIEFLYDDRYLAAGYMLQILSLGSAPAILRILTGPVFLANGDSSRRMVLNACEGVALLGCMTIGGTIFGFGGFLWGFVAGQFLSYPVAVFLARRYHILTPSVDLFYLAVCIGLATIGIN